MIVMILACLIVYFCFILGRFFLIPLKLSTSTGEKVVFAISLGLVFLAWFILILALSHQATSTAFSLLLVGMVVLASFQIKKDVHAFWNYVHQHRLAWDWSSIFFLFLGMVSLTALLFGMMTPETANDSLCYHLYLPKLFLRENGIVVTPLFINTIHPFFMEILYTFALSIQGDVLAKFFHFLTGVLAAVLIFSYVRRFAKANYALYGALLFLTTPGIINQMGMTYVDVALALFSLLALISMLRWIETQRAGWLALSGIFCGTCLSVKYLGAIPVFSVGLIFLSQKIKQKSPTSLFLRDFFILASCILAFSGYWYIRNYFQFGNPVYPYFYDIFKSGDPAIHHDYDTVGISKTILNFLQLPWLITMHPQLFEGYGDQLGPAYLAFFPAILLSWASIPWASLILFVSVFYIVAWFFLGQILRFLFPALPGLAILFSIALSRFSDKKRVDNALKGLVGGILLFQTVLSVYHYRFAYPVVLGFESKEKYLSRTERSYDVAQWVNQKLSSDSKILFADETHLFYFNQDVSREIHYEQTTQYSALKSVAAIIEQLRKDGITHILYAYQNSSDDYRQLDPYRIPRLMSQNENFISYLQLVYEHDFVGVDQQKTVYQLYQLKAGS